MTAVPAVSVVPGDPFEIADNRVLAYTRAFIWALRIGFALVPSAAIAYLYFSGNPALRFIDYGFHEIAIGVAISLSAFASYVTWRCYRSSGEPFLRWMAQGDDGLHVSVSTPRRADTHCRLLLLWLGIDEAPKITLIAIGAFFPVYLNFVAGIQNVDRKLVEVGGIYGLSGLRLITRIFLPASLPNLFTGLRTGLSLAWMFLVAAELMAATRGLGYLLTDGRETGRADLVIVAIIVLALLGKLSDSLLRWLERRLLSWRDTFDRCPS